MEGKPDNDNNQLLFIDIFLENESKCNKDYFLNKKAHEPYTIADIYLNQDIVNETSHEDLSCNEMEELLIPDQQNNEASLVYFRDFIVIDNKDSNSHTLCETSSDNNPSADRTNTNWMNKFNKNKRSVLKKILPKTSTIILCSGKTKTRDTSSIISYKCIACSSLFTDFKEFQAHLKEHFESHYFSCEECLERFSNKPDLFEHVQNTHSYSVIKRPEEGMNVQNIEVFNVIPYSSMMENIEFIENPFEDIESFRVNENNEETVHYSSSCDDSSYITLEEAKALQIKMEEEDLRKKRKY